MKRKRDVDEPRNPYKVFRANKPVRCGRCQKEGHNARGCKANVTSETPWERRQRLQKGKSVSFYKFFLFKSKMPITNTVKKHAYIWLRGSGRPSARRQGFQAPASSQPPPTHQPYIKASSYPTRQQGHSHQLHSHKLHGHNHQLHGHRTQVSGTLQTLGTQLEDLLGSLQASQHHTPLQKHRTVEHHHHRYCSVRFDFLFIKL